MKQDTMDDLFDRLEGQFDFNEPDLGHEARFLEKLKTKSTALNSRSRPFWKPFIGIAASIALVLSLGIFSNESQAANDLASVSPEMQKTQDFFTLSINEELKKLNDEKSPETDALINDALKQLGVLESDYEKLKSDLLESGKDQRVVHAMIANFQSRIDILNTVLEQIESLKELKNNSHENSITL